MSKIEAKADSVLEGVKRRGAQQGDEMDEETARHLYPQILQEAFARELGGETHKFTLVEHYTDVPKAMLAF